MKKIFDRKIFPGFSLAEALITLLIICLITLASVPVLTKKRRLLSNGVHGTFACYWNGETLVGKYNIKGVVSDGNTVYDNQEERRGCIFNPPANASNFVVTVVGGGGGGASGDSKFFRNKYIGNTDFTVPATGYYSAVVIGGGGGGGGASGGSKKCDNIRENGYGGGGSSGGIAGFKNQLFNKNDTLRFVIGSGGAKKDGDRKRGDDGSNSYIYLNGEEIIAAYGGGGGYGYGARLAGANPNWYAYFDKGASQLGWIDTDGNNFPNSSWGNGSTSFWCGVRYYIQSGPGGGTKVNKDILKNEGNSYTFSTNGETRKFYGSNPTCQAGTHSSYCYNAMYDSYNAQFGYGRKAPDHDPNGEPYGAGGRGDQKGNDGGWDGVIGVGIIQWTQAYGGLGGKAGKVLQLPFSQLPSKTLVFPGKGGSGGIYTDSTDENTRRLYMQGKSGTSSYIKNYPEALPGEGAIYINTDDITSYSDSLSGNGYVVGGNGELANINPTVKPVGGAGGYSQKTENGYVNNNSVNGHTRPLFENGAEISTLNKLIGAGAGGGGGSSDGLNTGNGGRGSSGIVFIQW